MRVLLVDGIADRASLVAAGLAEAGCEVVAIASDTRDLIQRVRESRAEVIVFDIDDPGRDALESMRALNQDEPRPVVLFANRGEPEQIEAALEAGVAAYVVEGLTPNRVRPVIEVAIRRFRAHQALRDELESTRATLAARKLIDSAKARLMETRRLTEDEAYRRLRRMAMDRGIRLAEAAKMVLGSS